ncbi:unnamed protein product [Closterium sp. Yama58-4]|nr:unnamed protein product [Closterium sp. Yama58-4]
MLPSDFQPEDAHEDPFAQLTLDPLPDASSFDADVAVPEGAASRPPGRRALCDRCQRPSRACLCPSLPPSRLKTRTRVIVLQHPHEGKKRLATAPILALTLVSTRIITGRRFLEGSSAELDRALIPRCGGRLGGTWQDGRGGGETEVGRGGEEIGRCAKEDRERGNGWNTGSEPLKRERAGIGRGDADLGRAGDGVCEARSWGACGAGDGVCACGHVRLLMFPGEGALPVGDWWRWYLARLQLAAQHPWERGAEQRGAENSGVEQRGVERGRGGEWWECRGGKGCGKWGGECVEEEKGHGEARKCGAEAQGCGEGRGECGEGRGECGEGRGECGEGRGECGEGRGECGEGRGECGEGRGECGEGRGECGEGRGECGEGRGECGEGRGECGEGRGECGEGRGECGEGRGECGEGRGECGEGRGECGEGRGECGEGRGECGEGRGECGEGRGECGEGRGECGEGRGECGEGRGECGEGYAVTLVVIDGTWEHAREMMKASGSFLRRHCAMVCLPFDRTSPGPPPGHQGLVVRKEPHKGAVSTVEAVARALDVLERDVLQMDALEWDRDGESVERKNENAARPDANAGDSGNPAEDSGIVLVAGTWQVENAGKPATEPGDGTAGNAGGENPQNAAGNAAEASEQRETLEIMLEDGLHMTVELDSGERLLNELGYKQELTRRLGFVDVFSIGLSTIIIYAGVVPFYAQTYVNGGPVALVWYWWLTALFTHCVALTFAEVSSSFPISGSLYFWAAALAGPKHGPFAAWITVRALLPPSSPPFIPSFLTTLHTLLPFAAWDTVTSPPSLSDAFLLKSLPPSPLLPPHPSYFFNPPSSSPPSPLFLDPIPPPRHPPHSSSSPLPPQPPFLCFPCVGPLSLLSPTPQKRLTVSFPLLQTDPHFLSFLPHFPRSPLLPLSSLASSPLPPPYQPQGWLEFFGISVGLGGVAFGGVQLLQYTIFAATGGANNGGFFFSNYECFGITAGVLIMGGLLTSLPIKVIGRINVFTAVWQIVLTLVIIVLLPCVAVTTQPASFVFAHYHVQLNQSQLPNAAYAFVVALQLSLYGQYSYDTVAHMAEETKHADRTIPLAMVASLSCVCVLGWGLLVALTFCIQNDDRLLGTNNETRGEYPVVQIIWDVFFSRYGSGTGAVIILCCMSLAFFLGVVGGLTGASRAAYSLSRDSGLPFASLWRRVNPSRTPIYAVWLCCSIAILFSLPLLDDSNTFHFITSLATVAWVGSYAVPIFFRLIQRDEDFEPGAFSLANYVGHTGSYAVPIFFRLIQKDEDFEPGAFCLANYVSHTGRCVPLLFSLPLLDDSSTFHFITSLATVAWVGSYAVPIFFRLIQRDEDFEPGAFSLAHYVGHSGRWVLFSCR